MFDRNRLAHVVIWPEKSGAQIVLFDTDGVESSAFPVVRPVKGSELAKMLPVGCEIAVENCAVFTMSGRLVVRTVAEFDTAVVTERQEVTFEERMARLERRERRREKREARLAADNEALRRRLEQEAVVDPKDDVPLDGPEVKEAVKEAVEEPVETEVATDET